MMPCGCQSNIHVCYKDATENTHHYLSLMPFVWQGAQVPGLDILIGSRSGMVALMQGFDQAVKRQGTDLLHTLQTACCEGARAGHAAWPGKPQHRLLLWQLSWSEGSRRVTIQRVAGVC